MEEAREDQKPEADRKSDDRVQAATARREAQAPRDPEAIADEHRLISEAEERAEPLKEKMRREGFGDHQGMEGF